MTGWTPTSWPGSRPATPAVLVLTGITQADEVGRFPLRPGRVVASIADRIDEV